MPEKRNVIQEHENAFAMRLSRAVVEKPKLSIWMILIPIIMVYHFMRLDRYKQGRREFTEHYMVSRIRALDASVTNLETGVEPDLAALAAQSDVPEEARNDHARLTGGLIDHYTRLLRAEGERWNELVRSAYGDKATYLLVLNRLTRLERDLNAAIRPIVSEKIDGFDAIVRAIETETEQLRRLEAEQVFSSSV